MVKIQDLYKDYPLPKKHVFQKAAVFRALHGINLEVNQGSSFALWENPAAENQPWQESSWPLTNQLLEKFSLTAGICLTCLLPV